MNSSETRKKKQDKNSTIFICKEKNIMKNTENEKTPKIENLDSLENVTGGANPSNNEQEEYWNHIYFYSECPLCGDRFRHMEGAKTHTQYYHRKYYNETYIHSYLMHEF